MSARDDSPAYSVARKAWSEKHLFPLWEVPDSHAPNAAAEPPHLWAWEALQPHIAEAIALVSPADVERRVLTFANPRSPPGQRLPTTRTIQAGLQILLPGESARVHRHSMDALRFVLQGEGAVTVVDGKDCPMRFGDLILTPGWSWHEHVHRGARPIVWLDVLNGPLHRALGTVVFERGPISALPACLPDAAFAAAGLIPDLAVDAAGASPLFCYSYDAATAALAVAPPSRDGSRKIRYANPLTGGPALPLMESCLVQIDAGVATVPVKTSASAVCCVVEGQGESTVGDTTLSWRPRDVFSLPPGNWIRHRSSGRARLFVVSDREVYARLGLLDEAWGG
jgi:gentisate 1,2-dioxygenase